MPAPSLFSHLGNRRCGGPCLVHLFEEWVFNVHEVPGSVLGAARAGGRIMGLDMTVFSWWSAHFLPFLLLPVLTLASCAGFECVP